MWQLNTVKCKPRDVGATVNAQIYGHSCESLEGWGSTTPSICSVGGSHLTARGMG